MGEINFQGGGQVTGMGWTGAGGFVQSKEQHFRKSKGKSKDKVEIKTGLVHRIF